MINGRGCFQVAVGMAVYWMFVIGTAQAQQLAGTHVELLPIYQMIEPFAVVVFGAIFSVLTTWVVSQLQTRTSIRVTDAARERVQAAATNCAGRVLASLEGNLADKSFNVGSPLVAAEVPLLAAAVGDSVSKLGLTSDNLAALITAKIGILQSSSPGAATTVSISPAAGSTATMVQGADGSVTRSVTTHSDPTS